MFAVILIVVFVLTAVSIAINILIVTHQLPGSAGIGSIMLGGTGIS